jgi:hypothetical protein
MHAHTHIHTHAHTPFLYPTTCNLTGQNRGLAGGMGSPSREGMGAPMMYPAAVPGMAPMGMEQPSGLQVCYVLCV